MNIIGYLHGRDSAACLLKDGKIVAYIEEERLIRQKHAAGVFPIRSIEKCLELAGLQLGNIDCFAYGYDGPRFGNGEIAAFYDRVNKTYPADANTRAWQQENLRKTSARTLQGRLDFELRRYFGVRQSPPLRFYPHHRAHAVATFHFAPFDEALVLTLDGSGDHQCTTVWRGIGDRLELLYEAEIPHSLGWFYSAITEYLGFEAYDGEYKVMGLAAYGRHNPRLREALGRLLKQGPAGFDYVLDHELLHNGPHSYSGRFTDKLIEVIGLPPRSVKAPIGKIHEDLAFEAQHCLEQTVLRLVRHFQAETKLKRLAIGGGVAQNVKMNGKLLDSGLFEEVFLFPIPSDSGTSVGAALGVYQQEKGELCNGSLAHVYWGPGYSDDEIEAELISCGIAYSKTADIEYQTAALLASGKIVGWFQGRMEGGPRALGGRSILADPRNPEMRDRVNKAVKYREYWRPFCPSMTVEEAGRFVGSTEPAPFMIMTFRATDVAVRMIPAVVHVDVTMRIQTVDSDSNPRFYKLLREFQARTGIGALLNTSFNIKGEPIVCSPKDAVRTFWSTGLDALAIGSFLLLKPTSVGE